MEYLCNQQFPIDATLVISNNVVTMDSSPGFFTININTAHSSGNLSATIQNNIVSNNNGDGIFFGNNGFDELGGTMCGSIVGNSLVNNNGFGLAIELDFAEPNAKMQVAVENNQFTDNVSGGMQVHAHSGTVCLNMLNNTSQGPGFGYTLEAFSPGVLQVEDLANIGNLNTGTFNVVDVTDVPAGTCSCE